MYYVVKRDYRATKDGAKLDFIGVSVHKEEWSNLPNHYISKAKSLLNTKAETSSEIDRFGASGEVSTLVMLVDAGYDIVVDGYNKIFSSTDRREAEEFRNQYIKDSNIEEEFILSKPFRTYEKTGSGKSLWGRKLPKNSKLALENMVEILERSRSRFKHDGIELWKDVKGFCRDFKNLNNLIGFLNNQNIKEDINNKFLTPSGYSLYQGQCSTYGSLFNTLRKAKMVESVYA